MLKKYNINYHWHWHDPQCQLLSIFASLTTSRPQRIGLFLYFFFLLRYDFLFCHNNTLQNRKFKVKTPILHMCLGLWSSITRKGFVCQPEHNETFTPAVHELIANIRYILNTFPVHKNLVYRYLEFKITKFSPGSGANS